MSYYAHRRKPGLPSDLLTWITLFGIHALFYVGVGIGVGYLIWR